MTVNDVDSMARTGCGVASALYLMLPSSRWGLGAVKASAATEGS